MVVLALLLLGGLVGPAYGWGSRRYAVTSTGLTEVRGLFRIQTRSLAWRDISSVEVLAPWNARPFGLRVVVLGADGSADSTIRIEGVPVADAEDISQSARLGHRGPRGGEDPARVQTSRSQAPADEDRIHRSSSLDLIISSLCYGQAVVLAGAVVGAAVQIMELAGHSAEVVQALATRPGPVLALLCLVGLTAGAVLTAVRFHGLTVAVEDGRTVLRHGLISTTTRIIGRDQVVGVQVRRNLVEMLLDRARVSLITADSSQQWDSNLALPSLSRRRILVLMARLAPGARIPPPLVAPGPAVLPVSLALALLPVAAGSAVAWGAAQWWPAGPSWPWPSGRRCCCWGC
ncbi:PH domain-containing protein [Nesterenkonia sp. PF2B19]|uniref:PH domain-containing protein n=1 Tax=Nesterenkonia sp. PF2B19 TaxID=1881858 RepID=UPI0014821402|nr:PH domain-containing protein [Nesterenkonia sp. PF2B19]